jgi:hypothetical protein
MPKYKAVLFAADGRWVTDFRDSSSISEVQDRLNDMGSRWFFFPFHAVIRDHIVTRPTNRIVDAAWPFEHMKGRRISTFSNMIAQIPEKELRSILSA